MGKSIHTKFSTFMAFEAKNNLSAKNRILGVFSQRDYKDCINTLNEIEQSRWISINWFPRTSSGKTPSDWNFIFKGGRLMVIYDMDPTLLGGLPEIGVTYIPAIAGITIERDGRVFYAGDYRYRTIPNEKAQELLSGYDHLWPVLSEYSTIRRPEDLSLTEMFELLVRLSDATDENQLTADKIMSNVKVWIEENRKTNPSLMAALRQAYPKEYYKVFPDGDMSADMGDLGF